MSEHVKLRIGDRTIWLVPRGDIETWSRELGTIRLKESACEWPGRHAILELSAALLGPARDLDRAIAFVADAIDRRSLLALRLPDPYAGARPGGANADALRWEEIPRLHDLRGDGPGGEEPTPRDRSRVRPPSVQPGGIGGGDGDRPEDPNATFVAFIVVDQQGKPLTGRATCTADATDHAHALDGATVEVRPIAANARVRLTLADLTDSV